MFFLKTLLKILKYRVHFLLTIYTRNELGHYACVLIGIRYLCCPFCLLFPLAHLWLAKPHRFCPALFSLWLFTELIWRPNSMKKRIVIIGILSYLYDNKVH